MRRATTFAVAVTAFCVLSMLICPPEVAAASDASRAPVGCVYSTDIVAYLDGMPIDSYNIGGRTAVACEDIGWIDSRKDVEGLCVWSTSVATPLRRPGRVGSPGAVIGYVYTSQIPAYVNGLEIRSYVIDGKTVVVIEDLGMANDPAAPPNDHSLSDYLFSCTWDPVGRKINLYSLQSTVETPYDPICVAYESITEESMGLDKAHSVYEWFRPNDVPQGVVVFTGSDWEAGPVGELSYGAAHISALYGKVVCSGVLPRAEEFIPKTPLLVEIAEGSRAIGHDARSAFGDAGPNTVHSVDFPVARGHLYSDAQTANTLTVAREDGSELFSWHWNGEVYERTIGSTTVTASAVVVLFTDEKVTPPDEVLGHIWGKAVAAADGRAIAVDWSRYPGWYAGLCLEDTPSSKGTTVRLPPGRIWFEIVTEGCVCSY